MPAAATAISPPESWWNERSKTVAAAPPRPRSFF
jgi:hypothetical protein